MPLIENKAFAAQSPAVLIGRLLSSTDKTPRFKSRTATLGDYVLGFKLASRLMILALDHAERCPTGCAQSIAEWIDWHDLGNKIEVSIRLARNSKVHDESDRDESETGAFGQRYRVHMFRP